MSHYLKIGTGFFNLNLFRQSLNSFQANYSEIGGNFEITNLNGVTFFFNWIGEELELEVENSSFNKVSNVEYVLNIINYYYASTLIMKDLGKLDYSPFNYSKELDLSLKIDLTRWQTIKKNCINLKHSELRDDPNIQLNSWQKSELNTWENKLTDWKEFLNNNILNQKQIDSKRVNILSIKEDTVNLSSLTS